MGKSGQWGLKFVRLTGFCSQRCAGDSELSEMGEKSQICTSGGGSERKSVNFRSLSFNTEIGEPEISEEK